MARETVTFSEHLRFLLETLGIDAPELARILGTSQAMMYQWLTDNHSFPEGLVRDHLDHLDALVSRLQETSDTAGIALWVHAKSGYLRGETPLEALQRGDIRRVHAALDALEAGGFLEFGGMDDGG